MVAHSLFDVESKVGLLMLQHPLILSLADAIAIHLQFQLDTQSMTDAEGVMNTT